MCLQKEIALEIQMQTFHYVMRYFQGAIFSELLARLPEKPLFTILRLNFYIEHFTKSFNGRQICASRIRIDDDKVKARNIRSITYNV